MEMGKNAESKGIKINPDTNNSSPVLLGENLSFGHKKEQPQNAVNVGVGVKLITLSEAADISRYTPEHLNLLSRKGILKAQKIGRNWYTTKEWLGALIEDKKFHKVSLKKAEEVKPEKKSEIPVPEKKNLGMEVKEVAPVTMVAAAAEGFNWTGAIAALLATAIIIPVTAIGNYMIKKININKPAMEYIETKLNNNNLQAFKIYNENSNSGEVLAATASNTGNGVVLASESFKIKQINLGGEVILQSNNENTPLEITDIKSEPFIAKQGETAKIMISWKTNKLAVSQFEYSKSGGENPKTISEESYGFSHNVILSDLEQKTSYTYDIKSKDRWSNEKDSGFFAFFSPAKSASVFDLMSQALNDVFGWAIKK